jgi:hypothetical protein
VIRALALLRGKSASLCPCELGKDQRWNRSRKKPAPFTTTKSAETRIIDFFMAGTVVDAAEQFNRKRREP